MRSRKHSSLCEPKGIIIDISKIFNMDTFFFFFFFDREIYLARDYPTKKIQEEREEDEETAIRHDRIDIRIGDKNNVTKW